MKHSKEIQALIDKANDAIIELNREAEKHYVGKFVRARPLGEIVYRKGVITDASYGPDSGLLFLLDWYRLDEPDKLCSPLPSLYRSAIRIEHIDRFL